MTLTRTLSIISLLLALTGKLQAQDSSAEDEMNQFLNLLEQQTSLATQTRLNADFVPGMFSVLDAEQLNRRGFRTVWLALASIPGVRCVMNETGMRSISVRGVGGLFESSKIKLLLNGKALNASASATTGTLYDTPIEQVERIEFIRGPGSAIYGEFAYAGVLNVITRKSGEQYTVGVETGDGINFAALYSYEKPDGDFKSSLNIAASQLEGEDIASGDDRSPGGIPSYASGPINNKRDFVSAILNIEVDNLVALLQLQQGNRGDYFGTNNLLPPDQRQTVISDTVISADLSQSFDIDEQLVTAWSLNLLQNNTEQNGLFLGVPEAFGGLGNEDDVVADSLLEEQRIDASVNLQYENAKHKLHAELVVTRIEIRTSEQFINIDPNTNLPSPTMNEFPGPVDESAERRSKSLVLQDEYRVDDMLTLTAGLRYDDYEYIDANLSPRFALVWRHTEQQIFKLQLARAFKPPSLIEAGGSIEPSIEAEINDTLEFGHIFSNTNLVLRNTIYFSRLDNPILFQDFAPFGYYNSEASNLRGYEFEIEKQFGNDWNINSSLSLQDYTDDELPGAAPWMIKLGVEYVILPLTALHLQLNSIARRERADNDPRSDFPQSNQVDISLRSQNMFGISGLDFRVGIDNLLDEELAHPAPADTYPDDYPYSDGAMLWAQFVYRP
ncbi:MAG: TonB-dependent receptor [Gammaproteobacteria bacterium]|nr:TonB-dependent receptor [Gammaproteobacteria bacterium]